MGVLALIHAGFLTFFTLLLEAVDYIVYNFSEVSFPHEPVAKLHLNTRPTKIQIHAPQPCETRYSLWECQPAKNHHIYNGTLTVQNTQLSDQIVTFPSHG
ncbi:hypothetical protein V8F20_007623 [Naviculisporaceae sp. PSN 640]